MDGSCHEADELGTNGGNEMRIFDAHLALAIEVFRVHELKDLRRRKSEAQLLI